MKRSLLREHVFVLLFMSEFNSPEDMPEKIRLYMDSPEANADEVSREEISAKYEKVISVLPRIDKSIEENSKKWPLSRMGKVELSIIRLAAYEIFFDESVPEKVAINEAVELAKKYGQGNAGSFVNGVLSGMLNDEGLKSDALKEDERPKAEEASDGEISDGAASDGEISDGEASDGEASDGEISDGEGEDGIQ